MGADGVGSLLLRLLYLFFFRSGHGYNQNAEPADVLPTPLNIANRVPLLGSRAAARPPLSLEGRIWLHNALMQRPSHLSLR